MSQEHEKITQTKKWVKLIQESFEEITQKRSRKDAPEYPVKVKRASKE